MASCAPGMYPSNGEEDESEEDESEAASRN
jgi:hypothetical protein